MRDLKKFFFKNTSTAQTVTKNTFWLFSGEMFGRIIRFSIVIYATRLLGPAQYGLFAYVMAISAFLVIFSDLGISAILTRETVRNPERRQEYIASALALKFILILANLAILLLIIPIFASLEGARELLPLISFVFIFDSLREFAFGLNRALETMEKEALTKIVMNTAIAGLGFAFLLSTASAGSLIRAYILGSGIGFLLIVFLLLSHFKKVFFHIRKALFWPILKAAVPIGLLGLLTAITLNTDLIMLGSWLSPEEVGWYALAQKIILLLYIVPTLLASAVFPALVRLRKLSEDRFRTLLEHSVGIAFLFVLPLAAGGMVVADKIINFFGAEFIPATLSFQILLLSLIVVYPTTIIGNALVAYDQQKKFLIYVTLGIVGNIFFNILFIPLWGIEGAALSTLLNQIVANSFVWIQMRKANPFHVFRRLGRVVLASLAMAATALSFSLMGTPVLLTITFSALIYFLLLLGLKEPLLNLKKLRA